MFLDFHSLFFFLLDESVEDLHASDLLELLGHLGLMLHPQINSEPKKPLELHVKKSKV